MIISREYVILNELLLKDKKAADIFNKAFAKSYNGLDEEERKKQYSFLLSQCLCQRVIEWAFDALNDILDGFKQLDEEEPYDNGFTFEDVNRAEVVWSDENEVCLHLIHSYYGVDSIVKVVSIKENSII